MKIILSPTKKMRYDDGGVRWNALPRFLPQTEEILNWLREMTNAQLKQLWNCNDKIAALNCDRLARMDLRGDLSPAVFSYEGIAFQYMMPGAFDSAQLDYLQEHLRILSAFYGVLKPLDGVTPYRLEMQAKASIGGHKDLYDLWGDRIYREVRDESGVIIDLASAEYAKCVEKYLTADDRYITVTFCEMSGGKLASKGTYAKMARGEMVRYMAEKRVEDPEAIKGFDRLGYVFRPDLSKDTEFVFERIADAVK